MRYFLKQSKIKKGLYLQIYESHYIPGKGNRNRSYKTIGYYDDLVKSGIKDPITHYQKVVDELNLGIIENADAQIGTVSVNKNVGYFLLKAMLDSLDIDDTLKKMSMNKRFRFKVSDFLRTMIYAQVNNPSSKHMAWENVIPRLYGYDESTFSYDQILAGIEYIGSDYQKYIELFNKKISDNYCLNTSQIYFDCTNYYFEIDLPADDKQKGPCKLGTHNPIIGQALMLDANQMPIAMKMYPGNESEKPYLRETIEDMKERFDIVGRVIQVADKGLNCARNIYAAVIEADDGYIFSKSVHGTNLSDAEKKWVLLEDNYENAWSDVNDKDGKLLYRYKTCIDDFDYQCRLDPLSNKMTKFKVREIRVVTFNPKLASKQLQQINKEVDKALAKMSIKAASKSEYGDAVKYVTFTANDENGEVIDIKTSLNLAKIEEDKKYAGYNLLVSSETNMHPRDIYKAYHGLWRIEESFRVMKSYLDARPVYLQKQDSIYGHFLINYLSLVTLRLLELNVFNDELPINQIIKYIRDFNVTTNYDGSYINASTKSSAYNVVKKTLGIAKIGNLYLKERDIRNIFNFEF